MEIHLFPDGRSLCFMRLMFKGNVVTSTVCCVFTFFSVHELFLLPVWTESYKYFFSFWLKRPTTVVFARAALSRRWWIFMFWVTWSFAWNQGSWACLSNKVPSLCVCWIALLQGTTAAKLDLFSVCLWVSLAIGVTFSKQGDLWLIDWLRETF